MDVIMASPVMRRTIKAIKMIMVKAATGKVNMIKKTVLKKRTMNATIMAALDKGTV